jgi:hypothetical protein
MTCALNSLVLATTESSVGRWRAPHPTGVTHGGAHSAYLSHKKPREARGQSPPTFMKSNAPLNPCAKRASSVLKLARPHRKSSAFPRTMGNPQTLTGAALSTHPETPNRRLYFGRVGRPDEALPALYKANSASTSIAAGGLLAEH